MSERKIVRVIFNDEYSSIALLVGQLAVYANIQVEPLEGTDFENADIIYVGKSNRKSDDYLRQIPKDKLSVTFIGFYVQPTVSDEKFYEELGIPLAHVCHRDVVHLRIIDYLKT